MVRRLTAERRAELAALAILVLWVAAWLVSVRLGKEIPQALNVVMPMASASLLGFQLPTSNNKSDKKGVK